MTNLLARIESALNDERGALGDHSGILLTILIILGILAVGAWLIFNVDVNEK